MKIFWYSILIICVIYNCFQGINSLGIFLTNPEVKNYVKVFNKCKNSEFGAMIRDLALNIEKSENGSNNYTNKNGFLSEPEIKNLVNALKIEKQEKRINKR
ncbi:uncharacterized protein LOC126907430 isoform X1 [Daktulosphaira vitifoliae]|uniref:uncharacterized protein LOC126907430 isoform X1 n=1 Tax=Daktulosphaira vitifoliae TaxID=58002 RepID=UPI0021A9FCFE|nr:uncharacterized protein LOC126907430 isoform X1 [Daktulosphaira vitifoliae]